MSELHGHVEKLWSSPTPETVYKMNVPYFPGDNCPICAQPITIDRNIDGSSDWSCILCGWRREKSVSTKPGDYLPGQLKGMLEKPQGRNYGWKEKHVMTYAAIPGVLKKLVKESGMSANKLEQLIPVYMGALKRWDEGQYNMSDENLTKLASYFGVTRESIATERADR
jgi:ribosome-binding protein aMBF1 (putative translation factor)